MHKIYNVNVRKDIATMKLMLALGLTAGTTVNVHADEDTKLNYEVWGNPEYENQLDDAINNLPSGLQEYLSDIDLSVVILEGEESADIVYKMDLGPLPSSIIGVTIKYSDGSEVIYVEGSKQSKHYQMYLDRNPEIEEQNRRTEGELCSRIVIDTLYHEVWHAIDFAEEFKLSGSQEIFDIYNAEKENFKLSEAFKYDNLGVEANVSDTKEFLASFGSAWLTAQSDPNYYEELTTLCPEACNYMDSCINEIEARYSMTR